MARAAGCGLRAAARGPGAAALAGLALSLAAGAARAQSDADAKLTAEDQGHDHQPSVQLEKFLKGVKADGPLKLPEPVVAEIFGLLPSARRGEECPSPAIISPDAVALKDRGDGAQIIAQITNCQGSFLMAYSAAVVVRASRLMDLEEGQKLVDAHALNLRGVKSEGDLGLVLHVGLVKVELRLFQRREGYAFAESGAIKEFGETGDCAAGGDVTGGYASFIKLDNAHRLAVLRVDIACTGGFWQAKCELWGVDSGVSQAGICALPPKLDAKSLRAAGWK